MVVEWIGVMAVEWIGVMAVEWIGVMAVEWIGVMVDEWIGVMVVEWIGVMVVEWIGVMAVEWIGVMAVEWIGVMAVEWIGAIRISIVCPVWLTWRSGVLLILMSNSQATAYLMEISRVAGLQQYYPVHLPQCNAVMYAWNRRSTRMTTTISVTSSGRCHRTMMPTSKQLLGQKPLS